MRNVLISVFFSGGLLALSSCSTAGPFVTNISNDGNGGITVEKCMAHFNPMGFINTSDCTNSTVHLFRVKRQAEDDPPK